MLLNRSRLAATGARGALYVSCIAWNLAVSAAALAQTLAPAAAAEMTPAERAQRDAEKVYHWILINSDKPRKAGAVREDKPAAPAVAAHARTPARVVVAPTAPIALVAPALIADAPIESAPISSAATASVAALPIVTAPTQVDTFAASIDASPQPAAAAMQVAEPPDETLTPMSRVDPQFPQGLVRSLRAGQVQVRFTVLPDGRVAEPAVLASSNPRLNPSALAAVAQWRFAPLRKAQAGVVELGFNLD